MNYKHLSIEERSCIRKYYVEGLSYRKIAQLIGRSPSTVSREIRRNCTHMYDIPTYYPHTAQKKYLLRRSYCHRGMFRSQDVIEYINEKLKATWSPEQIACTPCDLKMPSWRTIYRWIYEKYLVNGNLKVLRRKGKSHGVKETRGKYNKGKSIREARQIRIQPQRSRTLGSRHGRKRSGKEQGLLCNSGRAQDAVLHCGQNAGSKSRDHGERDRFCSQCIPSTAGQNDHLRQGNGICELAQDRAAAWLRSVFCRSVLCMAKGHE